MIAASSILLRAGRRLGRAIVVLSRSLGTYQAAR